MSVFKKFPKILAGFSFLILTIQYSTSSLAGSDLARSLFEQGNCAEALNELERAGLKTSADFSNAGICRYKLGHYGQARAYLEKAAELDSSNSAIRQDLSTVRGAYEKFGNPLRDQSFWLGNVVPLARQVPITLLWVMSSALALTVLLLRLRRRPIRKTLAASWIVISLSSIFFEIALASPIGYLASSEDIVARSGPGTAYSEVFRAPPGTRVQISDGPSNGWVKIRFSLGNVGWVMEKDIVSI